MSEFGYAVGCVVFPAVWGVLVHYVFGLVHRRREALAGRDQRDLPFVDYSI